MGAENQSCCRALAPQTTLVASDHSTARPLLIEDCAVLDGNGLATADDTLWIQIGGHVKKWEQRTRVVVGRFGARVPPTTLVASG